MFDKKIKFYSVIANLLEKPKPASRYIPKDYVKLERYLNNKTVDQTVKACMPFLDAYKFGYMIPFSVDMDVHYQNDKLNFDISKLIAGMAETELFGISSHTNEQVSSELRHDKRTLDNIFKFLNPWKIVTPPGYSCLFTQPLNQNAPFKIIDGVVDTDKHSETINFPFYWTGDVSKNYLLKHGTPMVQVIPFKRDNWKMEIEEKDIYHGKGREERFNMGRTIINGYKNKYWSKKIYK
tara:strand:+ start:2831 stop:3541 length:711 start_codon:yes stop_codon:yes gene_type:complete